MFAAILFCNADHLTNRDWTLMRYVHTAIFIFHQHVCRYLSRLIENNPVDAIMEGQPIEKLNGREDTVH